MPDLTTLTALQERLRAATGPSRVLDFWMLFALEPERAKLDTGGFQAPPADVFYAEGEFVFRDGFGKRHGCWGSHVVPTYTTSVDAALALIAKALPEANCTGYDKTPTSIEAYVSRNHVASGHWYRSGEHRTSIPIALLIALVAALIAQEKTNG